MPSALPKIVVRASQDRIDGWTKAAKGESMNSWAGRMLDAAAGLTALADDARRPTASGRKLSDPCSRERHHRLGVFCKECGAS